ncbi:MAG: TetR/AcrR family transcriptional regulator [Caulobacterales bacterium]
MSPPGETATRPATKRYLAKKDRLVAAAAQVLNERGVDGFTLAQVAEQVGDHPATLGYYWRKDTLIEACLLDAAARIQAMAEAALAAPSPQERIGGFLRAFFDERRRAALGQASDLADFAEIAQGGKAAFEGYVAMFTAIARLFKGAPLGDTERPGAPWARLTIEQIGWSRAWVNPKVPGDFDRAALAMTDFLTQGLPSSGRAWPKYSLLQLTPPPAPADPRDAFLAAATHLMNRYGYRGASVDRISARLNRTKGAFYHHHADKDEVIEACFDRTFAIIAEAQSRAAEAANGWERIAFSATSLAISHNSPTGLMLRSYALASLPRPMRATMTRRFAEAADRCAGFIAEGVADGSVRPVDAKAVAQMVMATINSSAYLGAWAPQIKRDNVVEAYVRPALMGLLR